MITTSNLQTTLEALPAFGEQVTSEYANGWNTFRERLLVGLAKPQWTTEKPRREGYYWCRCVGQMTGNHYTTIVKAYGPAVSYPTTVFWDGENFNIQDSCFVAWSPEPIPSPENPHAVVV